MKATKVENLNYAFLDLTIATSTKPGILTLVGKAGTQTISRPYELKARTNEPRGNVTSADLIYLIMPDRFVNGDPSNDKFPTMLDPQADAKIQSSVTAAILKGSPTIWTICKSWALRHFGSRR